MKIDKRKHYILVLDTETANSLDDPLVYDIGFAVADTKGHIYERFSFIVIKVFLWVGKTKKNIRCARQCFVFSEKDFALFG